MPCATCAPPAAWCRPAAGRHRRRPGRHRPADRRRPHRRHRPGRPHARRMGPRPRRLDGAARHGRLPHAPRQGPHLAAPGQPDRRRRGRLGGDDARPPGELERRGRAPTHGIRPRHRLCQGRGRDQHAPRLARAPGIDLVSGAARGARALGRAHRPPGVVDRAARHLPHRRGPPAGRHRGRERRQAGLRDALGGLSGRHDAAGPGRGAGARVHARRRARAGPRPARRRIDRPARAGADPGRAPCRGPGLQGPRPVRPRHLAGPADRRVHRGDDRRLPRCRHRHREPADRQHVPAGPQPRRRARRAGAA